MRKRSPLPESIIPQPGTPAPRATAEGTTRYRNRFAETFKDEFFRTAPFGLTVSSIGIGTYLGDSTDEDDRAYEAAVAHALSCGINLIDTAINYRCQRSERAVGSALQRCLSTGAIARDEVVVCSKGGYIPLDSTPPASREEYQQYVRREFVDSQILRPDEIIGGGHSLAPRFLRYCLAKSRQNLGIRTIDIYYVHNPGQLRASASLEEFERQMRGAFAVLEEAATRGEIGVYGCATWDELRVAPGSKWHVSLESLVALAREVGGEDHHFRAVQLPFNLAMPEAARDATQPLGAELVTLMAAANALGMTVVGSATLLQSRLASGLPAELRAQVSGDLSDLEVAVQFARGMPGMTSALIGMKKASHVDENLRATKTVPLVAEAEAKPLG